MLTHKHAHDTNKHNMHTKYLHAHKHRQMRITYTYVNTRHAQPLCYNLAIPTHMDIIYTYTHSHVSPLCC